MHQQHLLRVAYGGAAGFCILNDIQRHCLIGRGVHIDMADPRACLDTWHPGVFHTAAYEAGAAPRDQQIHKAHGLHQLIGAGVVGILHKACQRARQAGILEPQADRPNDGRVGAEGFPPAAQHHGVAGFQGQRSGVRRHVRAAFIDNGDHAQRYGRLFDHKAVRPHRAADHAPLRIRQCGHITHAAGHRFDARRGQRQPVDHHAAIAFARRLYIQAVCLQNIIAFR